MATSAKTLMNSAKDYCISVAEGEFTPIVFERYTLIGGKKGIQLAYASVTESGNSCIVWI